MSKCKYCIYSDESRTRPGASNFIHCSKMTEFNSHFGQLPGKLKKEMWDMHNQSSLLIYQNEIYVFLNTSCFFLKVSCSAIVEHVTGIKIDTNISNCDCGMNHTQFASVISSHSTWCKIHKK